MNDHRRSASPDSASDPLSPLVPAWIEQTKRELAATIRIHERPYEEGGCKGHCVTCDLLRASLAAIGAAFEAGAAQERARWREVVQGVYARAKDQATEAPDKFLEGAIWASSYILFRTPPPPEAR